MKFSDCTGTIVRLCDDMSLDFRSKGKALYELLSKCSVGDIVHHMDHAGLIPECFKHDSTEEKLYAKYCDALLARALCELGLEAKIIEERADSADVFAKGGGYTIVGDAKAFRLSRTARNQKRIGT